MNESITTIAPPSDPSAMEQISEAVVDAIADSSGRSPLELRPLATVIDPDALERFIASVQTPADAPDASVQFSYDEYTVTVDEHGDVTVDQ